MPAAYPVELRQRVVSAYASGEQTFDSVARRFSVGIATVTRWAKMRQVTGDVSPRSRGGGTPSIIASDEVDDLVRQLRDPTAMELTVHFNRNRRGKARIHVSSMKRALRRFGYVVKKNADGHWRVCART